MLTKTKAVMAALVALATAIVSALLTGSDILANAEVLTALFGLFGAALSFVLFFAASQFASWTGVQIEEKHMRALHEAIMTGVESMLQDGTAAGVEDMRAKVLDYLHDSVPDALTALTPGDGVLDRLIERYTREALNKLGEVTVPGWRRVGSRGPVLGS